VSKPRRLKADSATFSTEIVDLTDRVDDPLGLLLEVKVGGGTHIAAGLRHARSLVTVPTRTLVVVVSDFEEGYPLSGLLGEARALIESGVTVLGCAFFTSFAGNDNRGNLVKVGAQLLQQIQAIHARQLNIGNQRVRLIAGKLCQHFLGTGHAQNVIAPPLQELLVALSCVVFVFDNQDAVFSLSGFHRAHRHLGIVAHAALPLFSQDIREVGFLHRPDTLTVTSRVAACQAARR